MGKLMDTGVEEGSEWGQIRVVVLKHGLTTLASPGEL